MANTSIYVSHTGDNTTGASWAHAYTTLATAITNSGTGGTDFWVDSTQNESTGGLTFTFKGAAATPDRVFSVTTAGSTPPVTADLTAGATFATTTSTTLNINGFVYAYGCTFTSGAGSNAVNLTIGSAGANMDVSLDTCKLILGGSLTGSIFIMGNVAAANNIGSRITLINTTMKFGHAGDTVELKNCNFRWYNTASAVDTGGSLPNTLFSNPGSNGTAQTLLLDGVDLSGLTSKALTPAWNNSGYCQFVNCKLPSGYTIGVPAQPSAMTTDLVISDNSATGYNQVRSAYQGKLIPSTTVYNNATDGDTPISWAVTATANANPQSPFECFQIAQWAAAGTYGTSGATKIFLTSATAGLTINDVWVDVEYLGSSYPQANKVTTGYSPQLPSGTPTALTASSPIWGVGSLGNDYMLQPVAFTTSADGYVRFTVKVGKPSLVVYIDPAVTLA